MGVRSAERGMRRSWANILALELAGHTYLNCLTTAYPVTVDTPLVPWNMRMWSITRTSPTITPESFQNRKRKIIMSAGKQFAKLMQGGLERIFCHFQAGQSSWHPLYNISSPAPHTQGERDRERARERYIWPTLGLRNDERASDRDTHTVADFVLPDQFRAVLTAVVRVLPGQGLAHPRQLVQLAVLQCCESPDTPNVQRFSASNAYRFQSRLSNMHEERRVCITTVSQNRASA